MINEDIHDIRRQLIEIPKVSYVEMAQHPDNLTNNGNLYSFRIAVKDYAGIPEEINQQFPPNLWGFYIDVTKYNTQWSSY